MPVVGAIICSAWAKELGTSADRGPQLSNMIYNRFFTTSMTFSRYIKSSFHFLYIEVKGVNVNVIARRAIAGFSFLILVCNQHRKLRTTQWP